MKKSNWTIVAILVVASIFFLWLWYYLNFNLVDNPRDLVLTIAWWAIVAVVCIAINVAEKRRQERIRTTYVGKTSLYNSEAGLFEKGSATAVEAIVATLANLKYDFHYEEPPSRTEARFDYIVRSKKFEFDADSSEVKTWEGDVVKIGRPESEAKQFDSRDQLESILGCKSAAAA